MKRKIGVFCFFAVTTLLVLPVASTIAIHQEQQLVLEQAAGFHAGTDDTRLDFPLFTGYLLVNVLVYTPGSGLSPCEGANISVRGLFYSYSGQTDENGDCLFKVQTNLFRPKKYFMKVSIPPEDWLHTKRISFYIEPRSIVYKEFLFIVL